ncbi:hypothetical protein [Hydrogenovibrio halophilus]|uniref:hypothetical protein n=1 Tax=Hydrogenovibrio halophilus TaxID=373391 RepID=UPI0003790167|nr:hypothetical protein [Hydrogenovibrio halophilus]
MEIGSDEHRRLLKRGIRQTAIKTFLLGLIPGLMLMLPNLVRDNDFSRGLWWLGLGLIVVSGLYAGAIAYKKARQTLSQL